MKQPGATSRLVLAVIWLALGAAMVGVPGWLGWTRWSVILHGHPVTLAATLLCALAGAVAIAWSIATLVLGARYDREAAGGGDRRTPTELRRRSRGRLRLAVPALAICLATVSLLAYTYPFPATEVALAGMRSSATVRVSDRVTWYEMQGIRRNRDGREIGPSTGLIFWPGARVDARAYAHLLQPLAEAGYLVVVLKEPFGLGLIHVNHAEAVLEVHPEITGWAVGGHSLGGVAAASFADAHAPQVKGLLLYASYPAARLRRTDLRAVSVSGSADGLATPAKVAAAKPKLPPAAQFVEVTGAVHSFFGDYGAQPGDGIPTVDRAVAQGQIFSASRSLLDSVATPRRR